MGEGWLSDCCWLGCCQLSGCGLGREDRGGGC